MPHRFVLSRQPSSTYVPQAVNSLVDHVDLSSSIFHWVKALFQHAKSHCKLHIGFKNDDGRTVLGTECLVFLNLQDGPCETVFTLVCDGYNICQLSRQLKNKKGGKAESSWWN
jgi:hypothetical protein